MYENSIAYGQAARIKKICSKKEKLHHGLIKLTQKLSNRGYKKDHIHLDIEMVKLIERTILLQK